MPVYPHYHFSFPVYSFNSILRVVSTLKPNLERSQQFIKINFSLPMETRLAVAASPRRLTYFVCSFVQFFICCSIFCYLEFHCQCYLGVPSWTHINMRFNAERKIETKGRLVLHDLLRIYSSTLWNAFSCKWLRIPTHSQSTAQKQACTSRVNTSQSLMKRCSFWSIKSDFLLTLQLFYDSLQRQRATLRFF